MVCSTLDINLFDPKNPDPWLALFLDTNSYIDESAKRALLRSNSSFCRRFLFPVVFPFARMYIGLVKLVRIIFPHHPQSSWLLHQSMYWGLKYFVSRDANYLIIRHFNIGTENLRFIADNIPGLEIKTTTPLRPKNLKDLVDDTFLIHDLNIFNFVIELNHYVRENNLEIKKPDKINYDAISVDSDFDIEPLPDKWHNFIDLHTAIELYTPLYALFLSDADFWRAANSLQLDQTIAIYIAKILDRPEVAMLVNNRHPMIPLFILAAGYRLMLHGHDAEALHGLLKRMKAQALQDDELAIQPS